MKINKILIYCSIFLFLNNIHADKYLDMPKMAPKKSISDKKIEINKLMRKLWGEHVIWTRQVVVSAIADLPDVKFATERLLKNQEDFGKAITPFYGQEAGNKLTKLLKEHILIANDIVTAAKNNNTKEVKKKDKIWHLNAKEIATFLSKANPCYNKSDLLKMLYEHLALLTDEVTSRLKKDWAKDIVAFDKTYDQALMMGDAFADGIIKQFPDKFQ